MEIVKFKDLAELGDYIYSLATDESETVTAVMFREDTLKLFEILLEHKNIDIGDIEIWNETDYYEEYYISLTDDLQLNIEPIHKHGEIHSAEADVVLFDGDVSSKIIAENPDSINLELEICDDDMEDDSDDSCRNCCEDCSDCHKAEISSSIASALEFWDYINTYFEQR